MADFVISPTGVQGPRGNTWLASDGPPSDSEGVNGDFCLDQANPNAPTYYGPKANSTWTGTGPYSFSSSGVASVSAADPSIVVGGTGSAPTLRTGTLDVLAAQHPAAADWSNNGHKITSLAAGVASTDAANVSQLPLAAPWVFDVRAYGAVGDGKFVTDGAMSSGSAVLTSASNEFGNVVANMPVMVVDAAPTGVTTLVTTAASMQGNGQITLAAANSSGSNVTGALVFWGTDDTAAIQRAINAALAYAEIHGSATVYFPVGAGMFYAIAGALTTGSPTLGNAQLNLGAPVATTGNKVALTLEAPGNGAGLQHWQQTNPQLNGATLVSFGVFASSAAQNTNISNYGNPAVIGGPAQPGGYGVSPGIYSNMLVTVRNLSILTTYSLYGLTYSALDFSGIAEANLENVAYGAAGTVPSGEFNSPAQFANGLSIGVLMPANGNNDNNRCQNLSCHGGYTFALFATEHFTCDRLCILYCWSALCPVGIYYGSVGSTHAISVQQASIEGCTNEVNIIGVGSGGIGPWLFASIDTETSTPTFTDRTSGTGLNAALGTIVLTGLYTPADITVTAPTGLNIVNGQQGSPAHVVSGTAAYTVNVTDRTLLVDASGQNTTIDLLSSAWTPQVLTVVRLDNSGNSLHIVANGSELINGSATLALAGQYSKATLTPARVSSTWGWYQTA